MTPPVIPQSEADVDAPRLRKFSSVPDDQDASEPGPELLSPPLPEASSVRLSVPLSWEQEQIWLHGMLYPELPLYTETCCIRYRGELNLRAFEFSLNEVRRRYKILRTTIREQSGTPEQVVEPARWLKVQMFDPAPEPDQGLGPGLNPDSGPNLAGDTKEVLVRRVDELLDEYARRPFDLAHGPLLRAFAARYGPDDTRIFLTMHHLIFDGTSLRQILLPELVELYEAFTQGVAAAPVTKKMQYAEYARSQQEKTMSHDGSMEFWRKRLAGYSTLNLPTDRVRTTQTSRPGGVELFAFDPQLSEAVSGLAQRERSTPFSVLLASFKVLLARCCDTEDVTVGTVFGGRDSTELESVAGCFMNILLLRTDLSGEPSFQDVLARVREVTLDAVENADAPFQQVAREALPAGNGDSPVQAVFTFQPPAAKLPPEWDLDVFAVFNGCAKFDLHLEIEETDGSFRGRLMYNSDLFETSTIQEMVQHWMNLIRAGAKAPETCIWKMDLLDEQERDWLLQEVNQSQRETPQLCVHDLFAQQASDAPEKVAVCCNGRSVTYGELERQSARIAGRLQKMGLGAGAVIGLMVERSPEMIAGLLGILRAGAAYVPLDPTYPEARLAHMMRASGMGLLLTQRSLVAGLNGEHPPVLAIEDAIEETPGEMSTREGRDLTPVPLSASAYIIFTSGSTGVPKGVEIPHGALTNLIWSMRERPGFKAEDVLLAVTSISFDIAALELYLPLTVGARIELATVADATDPQALAEKMERSGTTLMQATPATWRMLIDDGWKPTRAMKLLCGGEALPRTLAREMLQRSKAVWNMYGPTETTIWSACAQVEDESRITLGEPVANTGLYVLDSHKALLPAGVGGELYIGGDGLAKGYRGQAELTGERFPRIELKHGEAVRLYRTGDRVKRMRDGSLAFLGRNDRQIKLHGFRIELGEIEQVLSALPGVQQSIVLLTQQDGRGEILAAFVVPKPGVSLKVEDLRAGMAKSLPAYMQPAALHVLTEVPLTLNGKVDRNRLPDLLPKLESVESEQPRPGTEEKLAGMWRELLSASKVGRRDNFFEIGGHSLLAARFISQASRAFGRKFTFASFVQAATIAQFAEVVEGRATPRTQVLKQGSDQAKQVLWIGVEPWLSRFARHLKDDVSLYAFTPDIESFSKTNADEENPSATIEAMATQIMEDIREVQTEGPYFLAGFCLRSLVAYEVAQRLQRNGGEVALLILGDVYAPGHIPKWTLSQRIFRRIHRESHNLWGVIKTPRGDLLPKLRSLAVSWVQRLTDRSASGAPETRHELLRALYQAELCYDAAPYAGKVLFMESGESTLLGGSTRETWNGLISDVDMFSYPGIHENILSEPHLGIFAEELQQSLEREMAPELSTS